MPSTPKKQMTSNGHAHSFSEEHSIFVETRGGLSEVTLNVGDTVQLSNLSLVTITKFKRTIHDKDLSSDGAFHLVGRIYLPFCATVDYGGFLAKYKKEVYDTLKEDEFPTREIVRKVKLIRTNRVFPQMYDITAPNEFICRYKGTNSFLNRLGSDETDKGVATATESLLQKQHISPQHRPRPTTQRYTFGDAFCGIGGSANGARAAGLRPIWAFDIDEKCAQLYKENFPFADVRNVSADEFLCAGNVAKVDVLHISPPCQTWSLAHTRNGQNDDRNSAALFAVPELIKKARPRVCTIEQVPGFTWKEENK